MPKKKGKGKKGPAVPDDVDAANVVRDFVRFMTAINSRDAKAMPNLIPAFVPLPEEGEEPDDGAEPPTIEDIEGTLPEVVVVQHADLGCGGAHALVSALLKQPLATSGEVARLAPPPPQPQPGKKHAKAPLPLFPTPTGSPYMVLQTLILCGCNLGDEGVVAVAELLRGPLLGQAAAKAATLAALAEDPAKAALLVPGGALAQLTTLEILGEVGRVGTSGSGAAGGVAPGLGALGCAALASALSGNCSLTALALRQCAGVDCYAVRALCRGLGSSALRADLAQHSTGGPSSHRVTGATGGWSPAVGWGGAGKRNLSKLTLSDCSVGALGCEALARVLRGGMDKVARLVGVDYAAADGGEGEGEGEGDDGGAAPGEGGGGGEEGETDSAAKLRLANERLRLASGEQHYSSGAARALALEHAIALACVTRHVEPIRVAEAAGGGSDGGARERAAADKVASGFAIAWPPPCLVEELDLSGNCLGAAGLLALSAGLAVAPRLSKLSLAGAGVGQICDVHVAEVAGPEQSIAAQALGRMMASDAAAAAAERELRLSEAPPAAAASPSRAGRGGGGGGGGGSSGWKSMGRRSSKVVPALPQPGVGVGVGVGGGGEEGGKEPLAQRRAALREAYGALGHAMAVNGALSSVNLMLNGIGPEAAAALLPYAERRRLNGLSGMGELLVEATLEGELFDKLWVTGGGAKKGKKGKGKKKK